MVDVRKIKGRAGSIDNPGAFQTARATAATMKEAAKLRAAQFELSNLSRISLGREGIPPASSHRGEKTTERHDQASRPAPTIGAGYGRTSGRHLPARCCPFDS